MAFDFNQWVGKQRAKLNAVFDITSGHDHDGVNSKLVSIGTPSALSVSNASVATDAAIAYSKLAACTAANIILGNASNVAAVTPVTGDIAISNAGVTSISSGVIVNDDINGAAAIAWSKLAASTDVNTSGQVTDFTISGETQGDVLYRGASTWVRLAAGTAGQALVTAGAGSNPYWGTPSVGSSSALANSVTLEAGANDYTLAVGAAGGAYTLTIPAVGGNRTFAFINEAQTFAAEQTFPNTGLHILDTNASHDLIIQYGNDDTADRTLQILVNGASRNLSMSGHITFGGTFTTTGAWSQTGAHSIDLTTTNNTALTLPTSGTLSTLAGTETLQNKTFYDSTCKFGDEADTSKDLFFSLGGATANKTMTIISSQTDDRSLTLPDATDTLVGKATSDVFTNKSFDCDGTGNVLTNVNANELDPITPAAGVYGIKFTLAIPLTNLGAAGTDIFTDNAPFKFRVLKAYSVATSADGGSWTINKGKVGALGTAITNTVTVAAVDKDYDEATSYDDAQFEIAQGGSLVAVGDGGGTLDVILYIDCLRVN